MPIIYIDNKPYEVKPQQNLLEACLSLGFNVPYFCWHPALGSVGACRQCAVKLFKDEEDTRGRIVMSCMTPAAEGTRLSIDDAEVKEFRASVIEWLMTNHPHDCPVCDEGGECHLQDMTLMTGHNYREYRFAKRTYRNQNLGPFINHEMNRCIQCYRCVRYYRDYAGGRDLDAFASHNHVYFGRHEDGTLESEFSGNLVEICPTGVFTDKTLKEHYTRRWDLQTGPSICTHCAVGCNTTPGERYGLLRRIRNRYNGEVNGYFLCDRGRYGYEFVNDERRFHYLLHRTPDEFSHRSGALVPVIKSFLMPYLGGLLAPEARVIGIGSPRASIESNFALRTLVGAENYYAGISAHDQRLANRALEHLRMGPAKSPSLREIKESDGVLVLGEDVSNTAPLTALALRQTVRHEPVRLAAKLGVPDWNDYAVRGIAQSAKSPLYIASPGATRLDDIAAGTYRAAPDDIARLGFAVAHALDPNVPAVEGLQADVRALAERIAADLKAATKPLIVSGPSLGNEAILDAAAAVARALASPDRPVSLSMAAPECNSVGLAMLGGSHLDAALERVREGNVDVIIVVENDLYRRMDKVSADELLNGVQHAIVLDHLHNDTTAQAELALPAATFAEGDGTFVNSEGRAQRFIQVFPPEGHVQESWRWLRDLAVVSGRLERDTWTNLDMVAEALAESVPELSGVTGIVPPANFRIAGLKIPRQTHRYSGRTAMKAHVNVSEGKIPEDPDSPLTFSMEGFRGPTPTALTPYYWAPGWNSVQSITKFQDEVGGALAGGDPGKRLIEPPACDAGPVNHTVPPAFAPRQEERLALPLYHVFGSEELSVYAASVAERSATPYVAVGAEDARTLGIENGAIVTVRAGEQTLRLPAKVDHAMASGLVGLPVGLRGTPALALPTWVQLAEGANG